MRLKTTGLIIKRRNFHEADIMFTVFSEDLGKLSVIAKRAKKNQEAGLLEPMNLNSFVLSSGKTFYTLFQQDNLMVFKNIREDLKKQQTAAEFIHTIEQITVYGQPNPGLYQLLLSYLTCLNSGDYSNRQALLKNFYRDVAKNEGLWNEQDQTADHRSLLYTYAGAHSEGRTH